MSDLAKKRIQREIMEFMKNDAVSNGNIKLELNGDNMLSLRGEIPGPPDTLYETGTFVLDITIPEKYPLRPPDIKFVTKIWHPNVSSVSGIICLDLLKSKWAAALTLRTLLLSVQALLAEPVPDDPQDGIAATQYLRHKKTFDQTARHWTNVYAGGENKEPGLEKKVETLIAKNYDEHAARIALSNTNWNIEKALEYLK